MRAANGDWKKLVERLKTTQAQLQTMVKEGTWVDEARKYAEKQGSEVRKFLSADAEKFKVLLDRERKGLDKLQKQIPQEVQKFRDFVNDQKKEFEKLLLNIGKTSGMPETTSMKTWAKPRKAAKGAKAAKGRKPAKAKVSRVSAKGRGPKKARTTTRKSASASRAV